MVINKAYIKSALKAQITNNNRKKAKNNKIKTFK